MSLIARCVACGTAFRVVQDQIKVADGWVRCGRCQSVFQAVDAQTAVAAAGRLASHAVATEAGAGDRAVVDGAALQPAPTDAPLDDVGVLLVAAAQRDHRASHLPAPSGTVPPRPPALDRPPPILTTSVKDTARAPASAMAQAAAVVDVGIGSADVVDVAVPITPADRPCAPTTDEDEADDDDETPDFVDARFNLELLAGLPGLRDPADDATTAWSGVASVPSLVTSLATSLATPAPASAAAPASAPAPKPVPVPVPVPASADAPWRDMAVDSAATDDQPPATAMAPPPEAWTMAAPSAAEAEPAASTADDRTDAAASAPSFAEAAVRGNAFTEAAVPGDAAAHAGAEPSAPLPGFLRTRRRQPSPRWQRPWVRAGLGSAVAVLAVTLALQVALAWRNWIATQWTGSAGALAALCAPLDCRVQPLQRIDDLAVESTTLTPTTPDGAALRLSVVLVNRGDLPVASPAVDLTLTDAGGELLARRVLRSADFSGTADAVLRPAGSVRWQTGLRVSGDQRVAGYTVELFYP